jgi:hypothetical protein
MSVGEAGDETMNPKVGLGLAVLLVLLLAHAAPLEAATVVLSVEGMT